MEGNALTEGGDERKRDENIPPYLRK